MGRKSKARVIFTVLCIVCKKNFTSTVKTQKYCSIKCRRRVATKQFEARSCAYNSCGKKYTPIRATQKFCSFQCHYLSNLYERPIYICVKCGHKQFRKK